MNQININIKGLEHSEDKESIESAVTDSCKQVFNIAYERGYREAYNLAFEEGRLDKTHELTEAAERVRALMFTGGSNA